MLPCWRRSFAIRYSARGIYQSAGKHGVADEDIEHAVARALAAGEAEDRKVLYLGLGRSGNLLEVVSVLRDGSEVVIHAIPMRRQYEGFLRGQGQG